MYDCRHERSEIRRQACGHIGRQCLDCGGHADGGRWLKHADFPDPAALPAWSEEAPAKDDASRIALAGPRDSARMPRYVDRAEYARYLASDVWRRRRDKVMERDGGQCQGCLSRPASDVHHLTYRHLYAEFAFELVSLCRACHERVHAEACEIDAASR